MNFHQFNQFNNYDGQTQTPSPPLSEPNSPNNGLVSGQKVVLHDTCSYNHPFSSPLPTPEPTRQFPFNTEHYQPTYYSRFDSRFSIETSSKAFCDSSCCSRRNQPSFEGTTVHAVDTRDDLIQGSFVNSGTRRSTCLMSHETKGKTTTTQFTANSNVPEIETNSDREIYVVRRDDDSRAEQGDESSGLMKISYILNSPTRSPPDHSGSRYLSKAKISKVKSFDKPISERKRKSNSLARVMQDCGLLKNTTNITSTTFTETKSALFPTPTIMEIEELKRNIDGLNIDMSSLDDAEVTIKWKGQPLNIYHLTNYSILHPKEAQVTSILRLTPVQYLTSKYILISSARRYVEKNLPFRKSDAQKLLRIDVNKASKLWEFFQQIKWI